MYFSLPHIKFELKAKLIANVHVFIKVCQILKKLYTVCQRLYLMRSVKHFLLNNKICVHQLSKAFYITGKYNFSIKKATNNNFIRCFKNIKYIKKLLLICSKIILIFIFGLIFFTNLCFQ